MSHFKSQRLVAPTWGLAATILVVMCAYAAPVAAQPQKKPPPKPDPKPCVGTNCPAEAKAPTPDALPKSGDAKGGEGKEKKGGNAKEKNFDFNALDLNGRMRTPQLLYFLERANEELERASLEKRSFIPHIVRSVEEEQL